jgi:hypothetical protein
VLHDLGLDVLQHNLSMIAGSFVNCEARHTDCCELTVLFA